MLDAGKSAHGIGDSRGGSAFEARGGSGGQNIFEIVRAGQRNFFALQQNFFLLSAAEDDFFATQVRALQDFLFAAEPIDLRTLGRQEYARRIIRVQHREIAFGLIFKDAGFGRRVGVHGSCGGRDDRA